VQYPSIKVAYFFKFEIHLLFPPQITICLLDDYSIFYKNTLFNFHSIQLHLLSGRSETFRFLSPLRTVLVTFTTYGSSHHFSLQLYLKFLNSRFINFIPSLLDGFMSISLKNLFIWVSSLPPPYLFNKY
jgi:hypothetical protein